MSATIDERIVSMKFNNKDFEDNAKTSLNTIERLKQALNFSSSSSGLDNIAQSVKKVDMNSLGNAVESVKVKFSALQVVAIAALNNIVNKAIAAGSQLAQSLTIAPIAQGFNEYELKLGSIQTILANTQNQVPKASSQAINEVNAAADQAVQRSEELNQQAIKNLQKRQQAELKALEKSNQAQLKALEKSQKAQSKTLDKKHKQEVEKVQEAEEKKQEALQKSQEKQMETLNNTYEKRYEALAKTESNELELLKKNHQTKLDMYQEEYMQQLKVADENRYNQIKAIDDQISALKGLSKAEKKAREDVEKQAKLASLQSLLTKAETDDERMYVEKQISEYQAELDAERSEEERQNRIEELEARKDDINEEYSAVKETLSKEYSDRVDAENDIYSAEIESLREAQTVRRKAIQESYEEELEMLQNKQQKESKALQKKQKAEQEALAERQQNETEALNDRQQDAREKLSERQEAAKEALTERQSAAMEALSAQHETALANIESEKQAKIKALNAAAAKDVKPTTLEDVNKALDELNTYADKTIYNFADMTHNIGTFTAAGVDLDTSVDAIKGIANLAALVGANSSKASNAMYQLSQAIASGTVRAEDWRSVETSDMAGIEFQNALKETARVHGIAVDDMIQKNGSFRLSLQEGWLSSEILLETLQKFTGDMTDEELRALGYSEEQIKSIQETAKTAVEAATKVRTWTQLLGTAREAVGSGWAETFEIIFGDFDEATELWSGINDVVSAAIDKQADARNELLRGWKSMGGRDALIQAFKNVWEALHRIIVPIQQAFRDIFPPATSRSLLNFTNSFKDLTKNFIISYPTFFKLRKAFSGIFAVVDLGIQVVSALFNGLSPALGIIKDLAWAVLDASVEFGEWITGVDKAAKETGIFSDGAKLLSDTINSAYTSFKDFIKGISDWLSTSLGFENGLFDGIVTTISDFVGQIWDLLTSIGSSFSGASESIDKRFSPLQSLFGIIGTSIKAIYDVFSKIGAPLSKMAGIIGKALSDIGSTIGKVFTSGDFNSVLDIFNGGVFAYIGVQIAKFIKNISTVSETGSGIIKGIKDIKDAVLDTFGAFQAQIKSKTLITIASAIAILALSLLAISSIDSKKLTGSLGAVSVLIGEMMASMTALNKVLDKQGSKNISRVAATMIALGLSVSILASALRKVSEINKDKILSSLGVISVLLAEMAAVSVAMSKFGGKIKAGSLSLIALATSVLILTQAVKQLADLDTNQLIKGLTSVGVLLGEIAAFMAVAKFGKIKPSQATGILILASSLLVFQKSIATFGDMDLDVLLKGLATVGTILAELGLFSVLAGSAKHILKTSVYMTILAAAMVILEKPIKDFGEMSLETIGKGLLVMGGALAEIAIAMNLMKGTVRGTAAMVAMVGILLTLIPVLTSLGEMKWESIAKGLVAIGGALAEFVVAMRLMKSTVRGIAALLTMSAALAVLTPVLKVLGGMSIQEIALALIALAGAFTVVGVAGAVLGPLAPSIIALASAVALLGVGMAAAGVGVLAFAAGLGALAAGGVAAATAFVATFQIIFTGILRTISESGKEISAAFKTLILSFCDVIVTCVPEIVETLLVVVEAVLTSLAQHAPEIVEQLITFLTGVIDSLRENLPELVTAVVDLFVTFFASIIEALKQMDTETLENALLGIGLFGSLMVAMAGLSALAGPAMAGIAEAGIMIGELTALIAAAGAIAQIPGLTWLVGEGGNLLQAVGTAIGQFAGGIIGGVLEGATSTLPDVGTNLSDFMNNIQGFLTGLDSIDDTKLSSVTNLADIVYAMADCETFITSGQLGVTLNAFADELIAFGPKVQNFSDSVSGIDSAAVNAAASAASIMNEVATKLPKTGGFWQDLVGTPKTLATYGKELEDFGPSIKAFSDSVSGGIDTDAVTTAANAAKIMNEVATKLPKTGGFWQDLFGENLSLADFGADLEAFGPSIKAFSDSVSGGIDTTAVTAAANAGKAMAALANTLPESGGFLQDFFGEQNLETFGNQLTSFGESMVSYSNTVKDSIDSGAVTSSAYAAEALVKLSDELPDAKGIFSFFTGEQDLSDFGQLIKKFGEGFKGYYDAISGIDASKLNAATSSIRVLVNIAKDTKDLDTSGLKNFGKNLKKMGDNGLSSLIGVFDNSQEKIITAINTMIGYITDQLIADEDELFGQFESTGSGGVDAMSSAITNKVGTISQAVATITTTILKTLDSGLPVASLGGYGTRVVNSISSGLNSGAANQALIVAVSTLCQNIYDSIASKLASSTFTVIGSNIGIGLASGMNSMDRKVNTSANTLANNVYLPISQACSYSTFYTIGHNVGVGLVDGLNSMYSAVVTAATNLANAATTAATVTLKVASPSKVFTSIGEYVGQGFANGMIGSAKTVAVAASDMANSAINPVEAAIDKIQNATDSIMDYSPSITPVLDLSKVSEGASQVSSMFNGLKIDTTASLADTAYAGYEQNQMQMQLDALIAQNEKLSSWMDSVVDMFKDAVADTQPNNTFNITSTDPREAANEVNVILQHQVERRKAVWGR